MWPVVSSSALLAQGQLCHIKSRANRQSGLEEQFMGEKKATRTIFQLVYKVLSELYEQVQDIHGKGADAKIKSAIETLSQSYGKLTDSKLPPIDYADPTTRFAYVFKYVASHADYVRQVLGIVRSELTDHLLKEKKLVVSCLGGGPGSELVGLLHHVLAAGESELEVMTCYLCDREQAWADSWTEIGQELDADIKLFVNFQGLDVTKKGDWAKQRKFLSADLFISCYFASEIVRVREKAADFWKEIGAHARKGAKLLFIDNAHTAFTDYISQIATDNGLKAQVVKQVEITPRWDEQKSDLGEFLERFGQSPKLKSQLFYGVFVKK
jgi:hypothetical protein